MCVRREEVGLNGPPARVLNGGGVYRVVTVRGDSCGAGE